MADCIEIVTTEVSVSIPETELAELKEFVEQKGGKVKTVERIEKDRSEDAGQSDEAKEAAENDNISPREIGDKISRWIQNNGIPQKAFAAKVLQRSQGSFSDYLSKAPTTMPKTHGRGIWLTLNQFLKNRNLQDELISEHKKEMNNAKPNKDAQVGGAMQRASRKRFSDVELTTLDSVFVSCNGNPQREVLEGTAKALKVEETQVKVWFNNQRRREKEGAYKPGQYSGKESSQ